MKIIIVVEGGSVTAVYCNQPVAKCEVIDLDLTDSEEKADQRHQRAERLETWSKQKDAELKEVCFE